jgi:isocitrate dehydrogenase
MKHTITLIQGDGVGPEIVSSICAIFEAAKVPIVWDKVIAGKKAFEAGIPSGVSQDTIDSISKNKIALKGPLETPIGHGGKSANVTLRKLFETYANIRHVFEIPGIKTPFSGRNIDLVIIRENTEDLYAGIEYSQSESVTIALKAISNLGSEKVCRFAFELAQAEQRKTVTCATKANILKITEGRFKNVFETVSSDYASITANHLIIDNCAHQLVVKPEQFDVVVMTNMNGDIISDLASGLVGGLGIAPSANIGDDYAIFEAVHGSAPDIAGKDIANPTALLMSSISMLRYIELSDYADTIEHALMKTLEDGHHTKDLAGGNGLKRSEFTQKIIDNLGHVSKNWTPRIFKKIKIQPVKQKPKANQECVGVDLFIQSTDTPAVIGPKLKKVLESTNFDLKFISNRGIVVYPEIAGSTPDMVDWWRCRLMGNKTQLSNDDFMSLIASVGKTFEWMHIEKLYTYDSKAGYSKGQGEN